MSSFPKEIKQNRDFFQTTTKLFMNYKDNNVATAYN